MLTGGKPNDSSQIQHSYDCTQKALGHDCQGAAHLPGKYWVMIVRVQPTHLVMTVKASVIGLQQIFHIVSECKPSFSLKVLFGIYQFFLSVVMPYVTKTWLPFFFLGLFQGEY